jgi:geranylgeranyl diphosphate synthase, type II
LEKLNIATEYAHCLGLAFQIIDDILDVTSTQEVLGKPIGSDVAQNKTTFVTLFGLDKSREEAQRLTQRALELLENFDDNSFLIKLTNKLLNRQN